jgi:hypothetical protein
MNSVTPAQRRDESSVDDANDSTPKGTVATITDRAANILAQAKYDALAAVGLGSPIDCAKQRDADRCGTEAVSNPKLALKQPGDAYPVDGADVRQTTLNDCHLMAPLAAIASSPMGRELIMNAIRENTNDKGQVVSYTVTLHRPESHWFGPTTFSEVKYTFDGLYGREHADPRVGDHDEHEVWPLVIEKAFAQYCGGYSKIGGQGSPARAMEALTGRPAVDIRLDAHPGYSASRLQSDFEAGKLVVLLSNKSMSGDAPPGLVGNHAYQVSAVELAGGRLWVQLHNPWNQKDKEPAMIPFDRLTEWFAAVDVGSVKP